MTRPRRLVVVAGTGTEVGKTWVAAAMLRALRQAGFTVSARKPAQSFAPDDAEETDADVLGAAAGAHPLDVCPAHRWYETPMAPPMAAAALGREVPSIGDLVGELAWPDDPVDIGIVEPAGGVRSPLGHDGDTVALVEAVSADAVVLVADAGLGTINLVRMSAACLDRWPLLVVLNRFDATDALHCANREWLKHQNGFHVAIDVADACAFARE